MGFTSKTTIEMLHHLETRRGTLDYVDINEIKKYDNTPWDTTLHTVSYFNRIEKAVK